MDGYDLGRGVNSNMKDPARRLGNDEGDTDDTVWYQMSVNHPMRQAKMLTMG